MLLCWLFVTMDVLAWSEAVSVVAPMNFVYAFMCLAALYVCKAFPLHRSRIVVLLPALLFAAVVTAAMWVGMGIGLAGMLTRLEVFPARDVRFRAVLPALLVIGSLLFLLSLVVHYLLLAFDEARAAERRALELQLLARDAELRALRSQIQPHFLFNSLNSISALTSSDPTAARAMTLQLADFFRTTVRFSHVQMIPLKEELQHAETFLAIEQRRFGKRLSYTCSVEPRCEDVPVPPLILQPLVENAVSHGIAHCIAGGTVTIQATMRDRHLLLRVTNPLDAESPHRNGTGVGIANIRRRLEALYGTEAGCSMLANDREFAVELFIPGADPLDAEPSKAKTETA
ncbi:MAG: sensor histidine kinase [Ignavibacteria bacterium]